MTNPPFAAVGACSSAVTSAFESLRDARSPASVNAMWPFWELAAQLVARNGRIGIVLPLSAGYQSDPPASSARGAIFREGRWEMHFFDRAPDAVFGDDVKQRVAIAVRRPGRPAQLRTGTMRRWSADGRAQALRLAGQTVEQRIRSKYVLKIGSRIERSAIERLEASGESLADAAALRLSAPSELDTSAGCMSVAPTAYNWLGVFRDNACAARARSQTATKMTELAFADCQLADAAYALLTSRVFLWWWRASGDLFHVPRTILARGPFPLHRCSRQQLQALAEAGRSCWQAALGQPVTAVNRGVATTAYRPPADSAALAAADRAVAAAFGLERRFVRFVMDDARRLSEAGRSAGA